MLRNYVLFLEWWVTIGIFIENYATLTSPLCKLLRKNSTFEWTNEHTTSIEKLKEALCQAPILCYPRYDKTIYYTH